MLSYAFASAVSYCEILKLDTQTPIRIEDAISGISSMPQALQINSFQLTKLCVIRLNVFLFLFFHCHPNYVELDEGFISYAKAFGPSRTLST